MRTFNKKIQTNVLLNVNVTGPAVPLKNIFLYTIAATITGTPTGSLKLQASNDPETNDAMPLGVPEPLPVNWADIANSIFTETVAGVTMWNVREIGYNYVRVIYTDTSGGTSTARMSVVVNAKGI